MLVQNSFFGNKDFLLHTNCTGKGPITVIFLKFIRNIIYRLNIILVFGLDSNMVAKSFIFSEEKLKISPSVCTCTAMATCLILPCFKGQ